MPLTWNLGIGWFGNLAHGNVGQVGNGCNPRSSGGRDDDRRAREPLPTQTAEPCQARSADIGTAGGVNHRELDAQFLPRPGRPKHRTQQKTAQCVGPLGLCLVLTIADRGLSAPAVIVSALRACPLAGYHRARMAVFTRRAAIPISEHQNFPTPPLSVLDNTDSPENQCEERWLHPFATCLSFPDSGLTMHYLRPTRWASASFCR